MSPQRRLSNVIDTILLTYVLEGNVNIGDIKETIIEEYRKLNDKCDNVISKIRERKNKTTNL